MLPNHSPWIKQLNRTRPVVPIGADVAANIAIVGGGIAGITTAFFVLKNTNKRVVLLEADKVAHGATGHNAGQIASYFERTLAEMVDEFGFDLAIHAQRSVESGWQLLDQIVTEARLQTPVYRFSGYAGLTSLESLIHHLQSNQCRVRGGLSTEAVVVAEEWKDRKNIPAQYSDLYTLAPHEDVLGLLETNNADYIASLSYQKGCTNSALFSEELAGYLLATYPERFSLYEGSPVAVVRLGKGVATLMVGNHAVTAERVVLCTNGFEHFSIVNESGPEIDTKFHHSVAGRIGYMSGYIEPINHPPAAISYFPKVGTDSVDPTGEAYFYLTRRPYEHEGNSSYNLVCTGGPEKVLPNGAEYSRDSAGSEQMHILIDDFLRGNYAKFPAGETEYAFTWHGLMGYTPNGMRRIGPEPLNDALLYNLGCNGVGILPSIFGAMRISRFINNEPVEASVFDPKAKETEVYA